MADREGAGPGAVTVLNGSADHRAFMYVSWVRESSEREVLSWAVGSERFDAKLTQYNGMNAREVLVWTAD